MKFQGPNHPFVVWASCYLWIISVFSIFVSFLLFVCVGDMLILTGTDVINSFILLSGILMLPTNVYMVYCVSKGKKIDHKAKVFCCPIWCCVVWIIIIDTVGAILCIQRIYLCHDIITQFITVGMKKYRNTPRYKHFIDTLQWSLKCCGLDSYKDWFSHNWYDRIRDYEWNPSVNKRTKNDLPYVDSVPLSCCKSGSCIPNYLAELGTHTIHKNGCRRMMYNILNVSMYAHLAMFLSIILVEICILNCIAMESQQSDRVKIINDMNVRHIMAVNDNFELSSGSNQMNAEDSEDENYDERTSDVEHMKMSIYKGIGLEKCVYNEVTNLNQTKEKVISQNWDHNRDH